MWTVLVRTVFRYLSMYNVKVEATFLQSCSNVLGARLLLPYYSFAILRSWKALIPLTFHKYELWQSICLTGTTSLSGLFLWWINFTWGNAPVTQCSEISWSFMMIRRARAYHAHYSHEELFWVSSLAPTKTLMTMTSMNKYSFFAMAWMHEDAALVVTGFQELQSSFFAFYHLLMFV